MSVMDKEVGGGFLLSAAVGHLENDLLMISHLFLMLHQSTLHLRFVFTWF